MSRVMSLPLFSADTVTSVAFICPQASKSGAFMRQDTSAVAAAATAAIFVTILSIF